MENVSNISSEEELLELRNEGKISEDEYEELLETLRKTAKVDVGEDIQGKPKPTRTSGLAIASLVLVLALGPVGCIPAIICGHLALRRISKEPTLQGHGLALAGLIIGYCVLVPSIVLLCILFSDYTYYTESRIKPPLPSETVEVTELRRFPLDDTEGLITQSGVRLDKQISSDGNGSLRIEVTGPKTIRLYETSDIDIGPAWLIYQARLRSANVVGIGRAYLEMWCHFPGKGESSSRGLSSYLTGTTDWTTVETPFFLPENPDNVKLNLVIDGKGTVWIDDIRLLKGALE